MARKRMIGPDFWTDEKLGLCKRDERLFFMGLISNSDDEGKGRGNIKLLKSTIFPYDDDLKTKDVEQMACSIIEKGMAVFYVIDGQDFYFLPNFNKHQVINKPQASKLPDMPKNWEKVELPHYYRSDTVLLPPNIKEKNIKEYNIREDKGKEVEEFFKECWNLYPNKKGQVSLSKKLELFKLGDELKRCISRYLDYVQKERDRGFDLAYKNGSTFFNNGYKDYLDAVYVEEEKKDDTGLFAWLEGKKVNT